MENKRELLWCRSNQGKTCIVFRDKSCSKRNLRRMNLVKHTTVGCSFVRSVRLSMHGSLVAGRCHIQSPLATIYKKGVLPLSCLIHLFRCLYINQFRAVTRSWAGDTQGTNRIACRRWIYAIAHCWITMSTVALACYAWCIQQEQSLSIGGYHSVSAFSGPSNGRGHSERHAQNAQLNPERAPTLELRTKNVMVII